MPDGDSKKILFTSQDTSLKPINLREVTYQINVNLFGYSSIGSINVERIQRIDEYLNYTMGMGAGMNAKNAFILPDFTYKYLTLPHQASVLIGHRKSHVQLGIGGTYLYPVFANE